MAEIRNRATLDTTQFQAGLQGMQGQVQGLARSLRSLPGIGAALSVAGVVAAGRSILNTADEIDNLATQLGIGTEAVQAYQFALGEAGVSMGAFQSATDRLRREQALAATGNERSIETFRRLGISMEQIRNVGTERLLEVVGQAMHQTSGDADAAAASYDLLGRNSERLRGVLIDLNKDGIQVQIDAFKALGLVVDREYIETLNKAEQRLSRFAAQSKNFFITAAGGILLESDIRAAMREVTNEEVLERTGRRAGRGGRGIAGRRAEEARREIAIENLERERQRIIDEKRLDAERRIEAAAEIRLTRLREQYKMMQMTSEELRTHLQLELDAARAAKESAEFTEDKANAQQRINELTRQLQGIRDPIEREERAGPDAPVSALRRIGGASPGDAGQREQVTIAQRQLRTQENTWRVLQRIEQNMTTGGTF